MVKGRVLFLVSVVEIIVFCILMFTRFNNFATNKIWFSLALGLIGLYSFLYYIAYRLDSSLYYCVLLITFAMSTAYRFINQIEFVNFYPVYMMCFAMAHVTIFVTFRQIIHLKVFAILALEVILIMCYKNNYIPLGLVIGINIIYVLLVLMNTIIRARRNLRRE